MEEEEKRKERERKEKGEKGAKRGKGRAKEDKSQMPISLGSPRKAVSI